MNTSAPDHDSDDMLSFAEESAPPPVGTASPWLVLIVDDEPDVHDATELALRGLDILGRGVRFLHAHSAAQARAIVDAEPDIAVILLDVVMETPHAGLDLVSHLREEAGRSAVRIVLRTGQPGYAPEIDTIRNYDINDYKTKTELTRTHLFTCLTAAIRSYHQLRQLETMRHGLETIISASLDLSRLRGLRSFAEGVVEQICSLLGIANEGLVCALSLEGQSDPLVVAASRRYAYMTGQSLRVCAEHHAHVAAHLQETLRLRRTVVGPALGLYFPVSGLGDVAAYIELGTPLSDIDARLIEVFVTNITAGFENVLLNQRLSDLAYKDALLDMPNRNALIGWLDKGMDDGAVLAQIDLDGFADINATLDHNFGDFVLDAVAARLGEHFPAPARLAHLGADVFCLLGDARTVTPERIRQVFDQPFRIEGQMLRLSATAGLLRIQGHPLSKGFEAVKKSALALKQAKTEMRGQSLFYDESRSTAVRNRMRLLNHLRNALSSNGLFLVYQPCLDLASGRIVGAEALLRFRTEDGELVPPDRFIPLAEESGMMVPIGAWVMRSALQELRRLIDLGHAGFRMAINVSMVQIREPDFVAQMAQAIADCGVPAAQVEIELTESVAAGNLQPLIDKLAQLRRLGVTIAIDDFGTGYSSLSLLRQLPLNRIKIDRSFVGTMDSDASFVKLIINLGRQLGLQMIAEGIETAAQLSRLKELDCEEGQGYLFSRPVESSVLTGLLAGWTP